MLFMAALIWILSARSRQPQTPLASSPNETSAPSPFSSPAQPAATPSATAAVEETPSTTGEVSPAPSPPQPENNPPPSPVPTASATSAPAISQAAPFNSVALLIPVAGVRPEQLRDTFQESRSQGRSHDAIDIPAARGTPVLAAADGRIVKFFNSERGGITIYQLSADEKLIYYYAHLERYADGLTEGHIARRGEVIAYVGDTGNAGPGNYHLHFSVAIISDPKRYWTGTNINPYPLLRGTQ